ncbi:MAG: hypothetical protein AAF585_24040, partial [Verrucomicrobiota bacterium]
GSLSDIDRDGSEITGEHWIRCNYLVLSIRSVSEDFATPGAREHCLFLDARAQAAHQMAGTSLEAFVYKDHGSLVSLSRFSTVGSLMGNLVGGRMALEGRLKRFVYISLYRMHLIAIHGWFKGAAMRFFAN